MADSDSERDGAAEEGSREEATLIDDRGLRVTLTWYGAAGEVAGSKMLLKAGYSNGRQEDIGIDMGSRFVESGTTQSIDDSVPEAYESLDALLITHAHQDHAGALKNLLSQRDYHGPIYMTHPTKSLVDEVLFGYADDHESRADHESFLEQLAGQTRRHGYRAQFPVTKSGNVTAEFLDAGHMLGSASILLTITDPASTEEYRILFSGDLGRQRNWSHYLVSAPNIDGIPEVDAVVVEGTYGTEVHKEHRDSSGKTLDNLDCMESIIDYSIDEGVPVVFTGFSLRIDRHYLDVKDLIDAGRIPDWYPFLMDSPTAEKAMARVTHYIRVALDREYAEKLIAKNEMNLSVEDFQAICGQYFSRDSLSLFLDSEGNYKPADNPFHHPSVRRMERCEHDDLVKLITAASSGSDDVVEISKNSWDLVLWLTKRYEQIPEKERKAMLKDGRLKEVRTDKGTALVGPLCMSASSGMLSMGRAADLARDLLSLEDVLFILSGYQAAGTTGYQMWEQRATRDEKDAWKAGGMEPRTVWEYADRDSSAEVVVPSGRSHITVPYKARLARIWGHSGHTDAKERDAWLSQVRFRDGTRKVVFLNHMDRAVGEPTKKRVEKLGLDVTVAELEKEYELNSSA